MMKFEEFLMQSSEKQSRRSALEEEVEELQARLNGELKLNSVLRYALRGPALSYACISSLLSPKLQMLLAELTIVEKEITCLETRLQQLKVCLYREKQLNKYQRVMQPTKSFQMQLPCGQHNKIEPTDYEQRSARRRHHNRRKSVGDERITLSYDSDTRSCSHASSKRHIEEKPLSLGMKAEVSESESPRLTGYKERSTRNAEADSKEPNTLSEELLKCLIKIFHHIKKTSTVEGTVAAPKHTLNCIKSKGFPQKSTFSCKARSSFTNDNAISIDLNETFPRSDATIIDAELYKNLVQITRSSLKTFRFSDSYPASRKLRDLMHKLCYVDMTCLSHKQKLAFWINIYNACIMHAYLQHGLPSTQQGMLTLLNKAALNVGGIVLNALAIEHYLLRHPVDSKCDPTDEKEVLLRRAYGLRYPEPNITFALCRGTWSSPSLLVCTPEEVVNQLSRAKLDYLETSIRVTNKKKILVPKLLQWHMQDFADDMEALIEWIYSQLPPNGSLKRAIMECLNEDTKLPTGKMIEIMPYEYEFRYLLPLAY